METIGRISISFNDEYKFEFDFLQNIPNKSKFICEATKKYLSEDTNLTIMEKFIKQHIQEKWECISLLVYTLYIKNSKKNF